MNKLSFNNTNKILIVKPVLKLVTKIAKIILSRPQAELKMEFRKPWTWLTLWNRICKHSKEQSTRLGIKRMQTKRVSSNKILRYKEKSICFLRTASHRRISLSMRQAQIKMNQVCQTLHSSTGKTRIGDWDRLSQMNPIPLRC